MRDGLSSYRASPSIQPQVAIMPAPAGSWSLQTDTNWAISPGSTPTRCAACRRRGTGWRLCPCRLSVRSRWTNFCSATDRPRHLRGQRLPAGNGPGTGTRVLVVPDAGEQPAKLDGGRQVASLLIGDTDCGGFRLGDDKHFRIMAARATAGKRIVSAVARQKTP